VDEPIDVSALGALTKLDEGGEGVVYRCGRHPDLVLKRWHRPQPSIGRTLQRLDERLRHLPADQLAYVRSRMVLPRRLVVERGSVVGFLMPRVPDEFYAESDQGKRFLVELQHLVYAGTPKVRTLGLPRVTLDDRLELLRQWTTVVACLHAIGVVVGDISERNLLWTLSPEPRALFIDCDAMRIEGEVDERAAVQAPDFRDPAAERALTRASDSYKLGLVVTRVLTGDFHATLDARVPDDPTGRYDAAALNAVIARTRLGDAASRPTADEWLAALGGSLVSVGPIGLRHLVASAFRDGDWERVLAVAAQDPQRAPRRAVTRALAHLALEQPVEVVAAEIAGSVLRVRFRWPPAGVIDEVRVRIRHGGSDDVQVVPRPAGPVGHLEVLLDAAESSDVQVLLEPSSSRLEGALLPLPDTVCVPVALPTT
jgi:hypothetical protein